MSGLCLLSGREGERDQPKPDWKGSPGSDLTNYFPYEKGFRQKGLNPPYKEN